MASQAPSDNPAARRRPRRAEPHPQRYEPTLVYALADHLKREGVQLPSHHGPWRPERRRLRRPGRNAERTIPVVTNGAVEIAVDTAEHATDLSGFLNAVGLDHLDPVPNLRPPVEDLTRD